MAGDRDPKDFLSELRWLANGVAVEKEWRSSDIAAGEFYCAIFDDYLIEDASKIYALNTREVCYVENIAHFLQLASPGSNLDVQAVLDDPNFRIAQKIAELL